jgi:opacity protein-like surface antigen
MAVRIAAASVAFAASMAANAGERQWYVGIEAGAELEGHADPLADVGYAFIGTIGHRLGPNLSVEGEIGYRTTSDPSFGTWDVEQISIMLNGVYSAPLTEQLSLNLGAGLGVDIVHERAFIFGVLENDDAVFAAQVKLGLSYAMSDSTDISVAYRYVEVSEGTFTDLKNSTVTMGLQFSL